MRIQSNKKHAADRERVVAFRLEGHNLARRLPAGSLLSAAGACGIQNTPPGSAPLSLQARIANLTPSQVNSALETDKTLLQAWSLRGAPHLFPTADAAVFTWGLLPDDEESSRFFITGIEAALDAVGMSIDEITERTAAAVLEVLHNRVLNNKRRLDMELADLIARELPPEQLAAWRTPSWYGPNQTLGEAMASFALRLVSLRGLICFAPRRGNEASFVRTDQWLRNPLPPADPYQARAELLRRYLGCFGPSTVRSFAEWAGISPNQAARTFKLVEPGLVEIDFEGRKALMQQQDVPRFESPAAPEGVRLLPPHDPFLQMRDKATLVPDKAIQRYIWRITGSPGVVLAEGTAAAVWRPRKKGRRLELNVEMLTSVPKRVQEEIEAEAAALAPFKGCSTVEVRFVELG